MTETKWSAAVCKYLTDRGVLVRSLTGNMYDPAGWPDKLMVFPKGHGIYLIEFKGVDTAITPLQKAVIQKINRSQKGHVLICRKKEKKGVAGSFCHPLVPHTVLSQFESLEMFFPALIEASLKLKEEPP